MSGNSLSAESLRIYSFAIGETVNRKNYKENQMEYTKAEATKLIEEKIKKFIEENPGIPYDRAYIKVLELNPEIAKSYVMGVTNKKKYSNQEAKLTASEEIARKIDTAMLKYNISSDRARDFVLRDAENEELVKRYVFGEN